MRPEETTQVVSETIGRVLSRFGDDDAAIERALFDTIYEERRRLDSERPREEITAEIALYDQLYAQATGGSAALKRELLQQAVTQFAEEVAGHLDTRVYAVATRIVPRALSFVVNALSPARLMQSLPQSFATLERQVQLGGEIDAFQRATRQGTVVLVPTHQSHLDSLVVGYGIYRLGLPPFLYGSGLNLFANKLTGFFASHVGAYKIDRRKKAKLYKDVLKTYAGLTLEHGYHNLYFPGGTRSRSGAIEKKLKLGLLGMALDAYIRNLQVEKTQPDIFIVPCTVNYPLVLEAETLIDDHLKEVGKSRTIIDDDEFSRPKRVLDFTAKLFALGSRIHVVFGVPLDVFGNPIDSEGRSLDGRGRPFDRAGYTWVDGTPDFDPQRDAEYTEELARALVAAFQRDTVIGAVNLVAFVVFSLLRRLNPELDVYWLLHTGGSVESFRVETVCDELDRALVRLRSLAQSGLLRLDDTLEHADGRSILSEALAHLASYHRQAALTQRGERLYHVDRKLLLYYQSRLAAFEQALEA